jgi:hypothetical protein
MDFWTILKESIYSPRFYSRLEERKASFSFKYFFTFVLGLSLAITVLVSATALPRFMAFLNALANSTVEMVPDDFAVSIKNGNAVASSSEPVFVEMPGQLKSVFDSGAQIPKNLFVLDTKTPFSAEQFSKYDTLSWMTKDSFITGSPAQARIQTLASLGDADIDKKTIALWTDNLKSWLPWLPYLGVFGVFVLAFGAFSLVLLYLLLGALIVMVIARLRNIRLGYFQAYRAGIHLSTLFLVLYPIKIFLLPGFPLTAFSLLLLAIIFEAAWNLVPVENMTENTIIRRD